jgi:hypothetical protein
MLSWTTPRNSWALVSSILAINLFYANFERKS